MGTMAKSAGTKSAGNWLHTPWGFALVVVPFGSLWWAVFRTILGASSELSFAALVAVIGVLTWLLTSPRSQRGDH